jgi:hypothetical protein
MTVYKKNGYTFIAPSRRQHKKYDVFKNEKYITSFGSVTNQQYKDKIGHYSSKDHNDKERRRLYYKRHGLTAGIETAKWFAHKYLW